jgi:hypothetical protein
MRQLVKSWRSRGIRLIPYINDFIFFCRSHVEFTRVQASVLAELSAAGLVVLLEKCQLSCSYVTKFLGFVIDTLIGQFRLTVLQKDKLRSAIDKCLLNPAAVPAKLLARVTGLANSLSPVVGPISGLFFRFLHRSLNQRRSWDSKVALDGPTLSGLRFWKQHLEQFQARDIWKRSYLLHVVYYDAGGQGWGAHLQIGSEIQEAHSSWKPHEEHAIASSTWRDLTALFRLLRAFKPFISNCTVVARGDARNVFWILTKGGLSKENIHEVCLALFSLCLERQIDLRAEWIPRDENQRADYLSKIRDSDDFGLSPVGL